MNTDIFNEFVRINNALMSENAALKEEISKVKAQYLADFGAKMKAELLLRTAVRALKEVHQQADPSLSLWWKIDTLLTEIKEMEDDSRISG